MRLYGFAVRVSLLTAENTGTCLTSARKVATVSGGVAPSFCLLFSMVTWYECVVLDKLNLAEVSFAMESTRNFPITALLSSFATMHSEYG